MSKLSNTNFLSKWLSLFADNTTGDISEEDMRDFRQDISDSFVNLTDHIGTGSGFPESLTSSSSISWDLANKLNGYARLLTGEAAIALTLSNFALGSKRTLLIQKTIAGDCVITPSYGAFTFYSNDSTTSSTSTITLRGKENSMFWVDFINYGNSANPLGIRIDVRKEDKDSVFKNIKKTSHGYSVGDIITTVSTAYVKLSALTQVPLGIIDLVQGVNGFRIVNSGLVEGLSGLTADTMYYVQSSGVLGTTVTNLPFLWAISTTSGYIVREKATDGSGTTVNGTAIDLGGAATKNTDIDTSESGYAWDFQIGGDDGSGNSAYLTIGVGDFINSFLLGANLSSAGGGSQASLQHTLAASAGALQLVFNDAGGAVFTDTRSTKKGMQYAAAGYVSDPRSFADKGYVDTVRVQSVTSASTITPSLPTYQGIKVTAQAEGLTIANPTGTIGEMDRFMIRIKDDGTSRSLSFGTEYRAIGVTLPSATTISKTLYMEIIRNATDSKWDVILVREEA